MFNLAVRKIIYFLNKEHNGKWSGLTFEKKDSEGFWFKYKLTNKKEYEHHCITYKELE